MTCSSQKLLPFIDKSQFLGVIEFKNGHFLEKIYTWRNKKNTIEFMEVFKKEENKKTKYRNMYYNSYGMSTGWRPIFEKTNSWYLGNIERDDKWHVLDTYYEKRFPKVYYINPEIVYQDDTLKYCAFTGQFDVIDYITLYRKYPVAEMFTKLGANRLALNEKALQYATNNKEFRKYCFKYKEEIEYMAFTTVLNAFKRNVSAESYSNSLKYRINCGKELANMNKEAYKEALKYASQERLVDYIEANNVDAASYGDYLRACIWLNLNLQDTKVLFPKDFNQMHNLYVPQYENYLKEEEVKKAEKEYKTINSKMNQIAQTYKNWEIASGKFATIIARSKMDLINEGKELHHCVGRMGYENKVVEGKSLIVFIRNTQQISTPFVTLEMNPRTKEILQCYAVNNSKPSNEVMDFIKVWIKELNDISNRKIYAHKGVCGCCIQTN